MWFSAVVMVVVSCVVTSVVSVVDVKYNDILSGESLQDLLTRTKKSSDVTFGRKKSWSKDNKKRTWNDSPSVEEEAGRLQESGTSDSAEITALLAEDIKEKLENLEKLENAYNKFKSDSLYRENVNTKRNTEIDDSMNPENSYLLESKMSDDKILDDEESIRIARQYSQDDQDDQHYHLENAYSYEGRYQGSPHSSINMYGDRGDPYLAQYNPSARTYGAAGIEATAQIEGNAHAGEKTEVVHQPPAGEKTEVIQHQSVLKPLKQLKQIIPNVINVLAEITAPSKPVQTAAVRPVHHIPVHHAIHPVNKHEHGLHRPNIGHHLQGHHGKKETGHSGTPIFFSKQLIFGIGTDKKLNTKNYGTELPVEHSYQAHSFYQPGYSYYAPSSYWAPLRDDYSAAFNLYPEGNAYYPSIYTLSPEAQTSYDPTLSPSPQGHAYIEPPDSQVKNYFPVDSNYRRILDPYQLDYTVPIYKNEENIYKDFSQSQFLMEPLPKNEQNLTAEEIQSAIETEQENIKKIKENLVNLSKNVSSNEKKETELSKDVKINQTMYRRSTLNEESNIGRSKVNKLCYRGRVSEKTGKFDFEEVDC